MQLAANEADCQFSWMTTGNCGGVVAVPGIAFPIIHGPCGPDGSAAL